jgi:hypothetical protein
MQKVSEAIGSHALHLAFLQNGYKNELIIGKHRKFLSNLENHCWVECDGRIYDITAVQLYKDKKIIIAKIKQSKKMGYIKMFTASEYKDKDWAMWEEQKPTKVHDTQILNLAKIEKA